MSSSSPQSPPESRQQRQANEDIIRSLLYHKLVEDGFIPPKELGIPLKQSYPGDWNFYFEHVYLRKYGPNANLQDWRDENHDMGMLAYVGNLRVCNLDILRTSTALLQAEGVLVARAIEHLAYHGLEKAWTALDEEKRKNLALDGLVRAAFKAREESRLNCPEMSLFGLAADGEYSLLNLLKAIVAHDLTGNRRIKSLYLFHHPAVESEWAYTTTPNTPEHLRAFGHLRIVQHNHYIVHTLLGILDA
ncbi:hypothetical protein C8J57DRAFT_1470318 [Mycena rebaudengoi]|nr:hypothetical protein C8J57DRAFT_1470318 [Mycena rebaudengoi]